MLVQSGTLHVGDVFVVGVYSGKVRALISHLGVKVKQAGPSVPVEVIGLPGVPSAGDVFQAVKDERIAREIAEDRARKHRAADLARERLRAVDRRLTRDSLEPGSRLFDVAQAGAALSRQP